MLTGLSSNISCAVVDCTSQSQTRYLSNYALITKRKKCTRAHGWRKHRQQNACSCCMKI